MLEVSCLATRNGFVFYLYSEVYFFQYSINAVWLLARTIFVSNITVIHSYASYYLKSVLSYFFRLVFIKMRFIGKGYKLLVRKTRAHHVILFNFGYSHRYYIYIYSFYYTQLAKTKFIFYGLNFFTLKTTLIYLYSIKPINIFTLRGLRFFIQCVFKKTGKVSLYM